MFLLVYLSLDSRTPLPIWAWTVSSVETRSGGTEFQQCRNDNDRAVALRAGGGDICVMVKGETAETRKSVLMADCGLMALDTAALCQLQLSSP